MGLCRKVGTGQLKFTGPRSGGEALVRIIVVDCFREVRRYVRMHVVDRCSSVGLERGVEGIL